MWVPGSPVIIKSEYATHDENNTKQKVNDKKYK